MRSSRALRRVAIPLIALMALGAIPARGALAHTPARTSTRAIGAGVADGTAPTDRTGPSGNATVLPNGRLVTPAGRTFDVGDFPLGVAVSPDGRLAVAINSGYGYGLNAGFNSYCQQGQGNGPVGGDRGNVCPYIPATQAHAQSPDPALPAPDESLSVVDVRTGRVADVKARPTTITPSGVVSPTAGTQDSYNFFYVGVTFSPDGRHLYAAGGGNDAIYDYPVRRDVVDPRPARIVTLPDQFQSEPALPVYGAGKGYTKGIATTPDGRLLLVAHEFNNSLDIVDTRTYATSVVTLTQPSATGGAYPYAVAVSRDGATAYVSEQGLGQVAVVALNRTTGTGTRLAPIKVGDHPTALALSPDGSTLYVANADDDTLSAVSLVTPAAGARTPTITLHALPGEQLGSTPNALTVSPDGRRVYVALAGDDAVAVVGTPAATGAGYSQLGLIPTGWYPSGVALNPDGSKLYAVSAKGLGSRYPGLARDSAAYSTGAITSTYQYDADNMPGVLQEVILPRDAAALDASTAIVRDDINRATLDDTRPTGSPIPASFDDLTPLARRPIQHVIEIVRENRTFDQDLGDLGADEGRDRAGVDSDPTLTLFGHDTTANAHAFAGDPISGHPDPAYATSDNFYSDGEASIQGHYWTAAANVNDYLEKSWRDYYSPRNHVYDPISTVSQPRNCTIFQSAIQRAASVTQTATLGAFTYRNYGELIGIFNPSLYVPANTPGVPNILGTTGACAAIPNADVDPRALGDEALDQDNRATAREFLGDIGIDENGQPTTPALSTTPACTNVAAFAPGQGCLSNFSYITLSGDHTGGLAFANTPRSRVAQNDAGVGLIVQALSHSRYWSSTAIFVMEDDSQDGLDHRDGHRNLLYVVSPYAKHIGADNKPGYVSHIHYSQVSVLKTIELLLGLPPLSTYDQNASALYDLFQDKTSASQLTAPASPGDQTADLSPYARQPEPSFIDETPAQAVAANPAMANVLRAESKTLNLSGLDRAGPELEVINWQLAHPDGAVPAALLRERRAWRAQHGGGATDSDG